MKKFLVLFIMLMAAVMLTSAAAAEKPTVYTSGDYKYVLLEDGTAEITDYSGKATTLTIPAEIDGYRVTSIGESAFDYCLSLTSVSIPDNVTSIRANPFSYCTELTSIRVSPDHPTLATIDGVLFEKTTKTLICYPCAFSTKTYGVPQGICTIGDFAFDSCHSLKSITIPDSVTAIGERAFTGCSGLSSITIPNSVTAIGEGVFSGCSALTSILVSTDHLGFATIDGVLFNKAEKKLICYPQSLKAESYAIPQGICYIGEDAFYSCSRLTSITIPDSVTSVGYGAFSACFRLTNITIPDSVTAIGNGAFWGCSSLTNITIPDSVTTIGNGAFAMCHALTCVTIPASVTFIGTNAFGDCSSLTTIIVPRNSYAAQYCKDNDLPYTYTDANDWLLN